MSFNTALTMQTRKGRRLNFQGPHIKENEVNDVKLKLMKLLKGYLSFLAPFCPYNLINKVLAEVSEVLNLELRLTFSV